MSEPITPPPPGPPGPPGGSYAAPPPPGGPPVRAGLPWERSKDLGSLVETAKLLITSPGRAFALAREKGDFGSPILFAIVFLLLGAIFQQLWQLLFGAGMWAQMMRHMGEMPPELREALAGYGTAGPFGLVMGIVLTPLLGIVILFLWSGLVHLILQLLGGLKDSTAGFEGTFRSASYASVANVATIVPMVGPLIQIIWSVVLQMLGLAELHRTSQGKALAAVLIPVVLCCCLMAGVFAMLGVAVGAALGAAGN